MSFRKWLRLWFTFRDPVSRSQYIISGVVLGLIETVSRVTGHGIPTATIVLVALLLISGSQFTLFAMWFDMESNRDLR